MVPEAYPKANLPIQGGDLALLAVGSGKFQGITSDYEIAYQIRRPPNDPGHWTRAPGICTIPLSQETVYFRTNAAYALLVQEITTNSIMTKVSAFHGG
jgi:hypothetical protein